MFWDKKFLPVIIFLPFFLIEIFSQNNILFEYKIWYGEIGIIEIFSAFLLFTGLLISLKSLKNVYKYQKPFFLIRSTFFLFLLIEEISFITAEFFPFTSNYNSQNELNIHNFKLLGEPIGGGGNFFGFQIDISLYTVIIFFMIMLIAYGSYIFNKEWAKILFLDQKLSSSFLIFPANLIITFFLQHFGILGSDKMLLHMELTESYHYFIIFIDSILKIKASKYSRNY